jgi:glycosyltransferase involved in cell wall biosynthesis
VSDLSIVVATYRSPETLKTLVSQISRVSCWTNRSEIVLVDDGNTDSTWLVINDITKGNKQVRGLRLQTNVGQHCALLCGIREAKNDIIVTLDDDLQNPPEEIPKMLNSLVQNNADVVIGVALPGGQSILRRWVTKASKKLMATSIGYRNAELISSFRMFRAELRDSFGSELGPQVSIDALLALATRSFSVVNVQHKRRETGSSNYTIRKLARFFSTTATSVSTAPLRLASRLGYLALVGALGLFLFTMVRRLLLGSAVTGFPFLVALIVAIGGLQLLLLGILGQYLGIIHFRVMRMPSYVVVERT